MRREIYSVYVAGYDVQNVRAASVREAAAIIRKRFGRRARILGIRVN